MTIQTSRVSPAQLRVNLLPTRPPTATRIITMANQNNNTTSSSETTQTTVKGHCVCNKLRYSLDLDLNPDSESVSDAAVSPRTTLCHCQSCRWAFGTNYGLTAKVPVEYFHYDDDSEQPRRFKQVDTGVTREFCGTCGAYICEYGEAAADKFRYVMWGTMDEPERFPPKGEFFCQNRAEWMPEIPGTFHKQEIKE